MAKLKIGTVGYVNMGEWNSETIYNKLKVVTYEGSSYSSLIDNNIGNIPTDKTKWQLMASKGDKGDKPINGQDYNTDEDKEIIKNIIVENAKPDIDEYVTEQKNVLDDKEKEIVSELENEKSILIDEIVDSQSEFDNNAKTKTAKFNENVEFQTKVATDIIDEKISRITEENIDIDPNAEIIDARSGFTTLGQNLKQKIYHFNNVEEMKNCVNLVNGDVVQTLGYYEVNDGGGATYNIRLKEDTDVEDGGFVHFVNNGLVADFIVNNMYIDIRQFGAKKTEDCSNIIINIMNKNKTIFIPKGSWLCNPFSVISGTKIIGENINYQVKTTNSSIITQNLSILQCNKDCETFIDCSNCDHLDISICLSSCSSKNDYINAKQINQFVKLDYTCFSTFDLFILCMNHNGISIKNCWENTFKRLYFRGVLSLDCIDIKCLEGERGISQNVFYDVQSEGFGAVVLDTTEHCLFYHNKIYSILAELTPYSPFEGVTDSPTFLIPLLKIGSGGNNIIDSIQLNNFSEKKASLNGTVYGHCIFEVDNSNGYAFGFKIKDIMFDTGVKSPIQVINQTGSNGLDNSYLIIDSIISPMGYVMRYSMEGMNYFKVGKIYCKNLNTLGKLNNDYSVTEWYKPEDSGKTPLVSNSTDYNSLNNESAVAKVSTELLKIGVLRVKKGDTIKIYYKSDVSIDYEIKLFQRNNTVATTLIGTLQPCSVYQVMDLATIENNGLFIAGISFKTVGNSYIADLYVY